MLCEREYLNYECPTSTVICSFIHVLWFDIVVLFLTDARRALRILEEYRAKVGQTEDVRLSHSIEKVISVFQSDLFLALIGRSVQYFHL